MENPLISVIMPVFNGEKYIASAIESILSQTLTDFEFLIINEFGSNKAATEIIQQYCATDPRIIFMQNTRRLGLAESINEGMRQSRGKYLARMDADDISFPDRFKEQVDFLENNPDISICGTWVELFGSETGILRHCTEPDQIKAGMLINSEIRHPTVMMRTCDIRDNNFQYNPNYAVEDFEFFSRIVRTLKIANIPQVLLKYRIYDESSSAIKKEAFFESVRDIATRNLSEIGVDISASERPFLDTYRSFLKTEKDVRIVKKLILKICDGNKKSNHYNQHILEYVLKRHYISLFNPFHRANFSCEIQNIITKNAVEMSKNSKIVLFGLGKAFRDLGEYFIQKLDNSIICVSDNDSAKWGKKFYGLECVPRCNLSKDLGIIVLAHYDNMNNIVCELKGKGFVSVEPYIEGDIFK